MMLRNLLVFIWLGGCCAWAQIASFDFYSEFRIWSTELRRTERTLTPPQIADRYAAKLRKEGVPDAEVERRLALLRDSRQKLEDDFWNRFFTEGKANYNRAPNAFLTEVTEGKEPGAALDYGMGEGRNALYLAKRGWKVSGFDPADKAVALAQVRAKEMGVELDIKVVLDQDYEFGHERFDLVLFSWTMPSDRPHAAKVIDSLKRGGLVVIECGAGWVGRNEMLKMFDPLQVIRYEIVPAKSDFFERRQMPVLRMVARKP